MQQIIQTDTVIRVDPGKTPDYNDHNSLLKLLSILEKVHLVAAREYYDAVSLQYLFPLSWLELYGPSQPNSDQLDPTQQDDKTDFQKQNVSDFHLADTQAVRGWVALAGSRSPFLQLSYRAGPDSVLAQAAPLGDSIGCVLSLAGHEATTLRAPYDPVSGRYTVELWGRDGAQLRDQLDPSSQSALDAGLLQARPDLIQGGEHDFDRQAVDGRDMRANVPQHAMHPVLPYYLDLRWTAQPDGGGASDPGEGTHRLGFEMLVRGWNNFLQVGTSRNPHGGVGFLEYRNLFSSYGRYHDSTELYRVLEPWNFDAFEHKGHNQGDLEPFFAVNYMDVHVLEGACGIGLHRHRDNQEGFLVLAGDTYMVVGDWTKTDTRTRSFEIRRLVTGHLAMLKGGNLHALMNPADRPASVFMFGGYD